MRVVVGVENLEFETGPFSYYGVPALVRPAMAVGGSDTLERARSNTATSDSEIVTLPQPGHFMPDYSLVAISNLSYIKVMCFCSI